MVGEGYGLIVPRSIAVRRSEAFTIGGKGFGQREPRLGPTIDDIRKSRGVNGLPNPVKGRLGPRKILTGLRVLPSPNGSQWLLRERAGERGGRRTAFHVCQFGQHLGRQDTRDRVLLPRHPVRIGKGCQLIVERTQR